MAAPGGSDWGSRDDTDRQRADFATRSDVDCAGAVEGGSSLGSGACADVDMLGQRQDYHVCSGDYYAPGADSFKGVLEFCSSGGSLGSGFAGDFYAPVNDTKRGLTLDAWSLHAADPAMTAESEPHCQRETKAFLEPRLSVDEAPKAASDEAPVAAPAAPVEAFLANRGKATLPNVPVPPRFQEVDMPPATPADGLFSFMVTTLFVSGISAARIGNILLDFLVTQAVARLQIKREKFSIKAEARVDEYLSCLLKIRLYQQDSECAVEFRRCSGDCVVFNACFQQAWTELLKCAGAHVRPPPLRL